MRRIVDEDGRRADAIGGNIHDMDRRIGSTEIDFQALDTRAMRAQLILYFRDATCLHVIAHFAVEWHPVREEYIDAAGRKYPAHGRADAVTSRYAGHHGNLAAQPGRRHARRPFVHLALLCTESGARSLSHIATTLTWTGTFPGARQ